jgi:hypothetical protein
VALLAGRQAELVTAEGNTVRARLVGLDRDSELLAVEELETPAGTLPAATLRVSDLDLITLQPQ